MVPGRVFIFAVSLLFYLCVTTCLASPVSMSWFRDIEVGQTHSLSVNSYSVNNPADLWFTISYNNTLVEISGFVFTDDPDNSRSASVERLANNKIQIKIHDSGGNFDHFADIYFKGVSPGLVTISIDYQRYGYYQGSTFIDRLSDTYSSQDSFRVYKPYSELTAPCRIEAENYDYGPNGYAYYDTTSGNSGGAYRADDVDISQKPGGGYNVGYVANGEWLTYTINVPEGFGDWNYPPLVSLRAASWNDGCKIKLSSGYGEKTVEIGNTQNEWRTFTTNLSVWPGEPNTIKVEFIGTGQILDYIEFVKLKPIAHFEISDNQFTSPQAVDFTDTSSFLPTAWQWSFGDGGTSTLQNPSHTYGNPGRYPVTLEASNSEGSSSLRKFVYYVSPPPTQPIKILTASNNEIYIYGYYKIYNNTVLYADQDDLNLYNIEKKTSNSIYTSKVAKVFDFNDKWVVWSSSDWDSLNQGYLSNVYLYNIQTRQETKLTSSYSASNPSINGDKIVYQDKRNGNYDIFLYNITSQTESILSSESHDQTNPKIDGNLVVWQDYRLGHMRPPGYDLGFDPISNIFLYSLTSGTGQLLSTIDFDQRSPAISGNRIVWEDQRKGRGDTDAGHYYYFYDIYMYDTKTNSESMIKELYASGYDYGSLSGVKIFGDYVTWDHYFTNTVEILDLRANQEYEVDGFAPEIHNNNLIYSRGSGEIYLLTFPTLRPDIIPGGISVPRDLDNDGKYEDTNGNGVKDFNDIILYFTHMEWIAVNEPLAAFDYNGNGGIDFADVIWLFTTL